MKERTYVIRDNAQRDRFVEKLARKEITKPLAITIMAYRKQRSILKNAMLHGVLRQLSRKLYESGWSSTIIPPEALKLDARQRFLGTTTAIVMGQVVEETRHTSDLDDCETVKLVDDIVHYYGAQYNIELVVGPEYWELKNTEKRNV